MTTTTTTLYPRKSAALAVVRILAVITAVAGAAILGFAPPTFALRFKAVILITASALMLWILHRYHSRMRVVLTDDGLERYGVFGASKPLSATHLDTVHRAQFGRSGGRLVTAVLITRKDRQAGAEFTEWEWPAPVLDQVVHHLRDLGTSVTEHASPFTPRNYQALRSTAGLQGNAGRNMVALAAVAGVWGYSTLDTMAVLAQLLR